MSDSLYLTRKQIARALGETVYVVRANEKRWGLSACRVDFNARMVRYRKSEAVRILQKQNIQLTA